MSNRKQQLDPIHEYTVDKSGQGAAYLLKRDGNLVSCPFVPPTPTQNKIRNEIELQQHPCSTACAKAEILSMETTDEGTLYFYRQACGMGGTFYVSNLADKQEDKGSKDFKPDKIILSKA